MAVRKNEIHSIVADDAEATTARAAAAQFRQVMDDGPGVGLVGGGKTIEIVIKRDDEAEGPVPIPPRAAGLILELLSAMGEQTPVSVVPHNVELTTQQAADYLKVSRPYLIRQIEDGQLVARKIGSHRRIRFSDLLAYQITMQDRQLKALIELNDEAHRLGLE